MNGKLSFMIILGRRRYHPTTIIGASPLSHGFRFRIPFSQFMNIVRHQDSMEMG
ncbi:hypothetical protein SERLA73DRAFT_177200, partial [Serpula lacrymans var. lacrymans S7.3]